MPIKSDFHTIKNVNSVNRFRISENICLTIRNQKHGKSITRVEGVGTRTGEGGWDLDNFLNVNKRVGCYYQRRKNTDDLGHPV